jgi:hypothetical protein
VNYNGVLSFGTESFTAYYAVPFPFRSPPLIAPFWDDIEDFFWNGLYYRQTNDSDLLQLFYNYTLLLNNGDSKLESDDYYPTHLFIATWDEAPRFTYYFSFDPGVEVHYIIGIWHNNNMQLTKHALD